MRHQNKLVFFIILQHNPIVLVTAAEQSCKCVRKCLSWQKRAAYNFILHSVLHSSMVDECIHSDRRRVGYPRQHGMLSNCDQTRCACSTGDAARRTGRTPRG